MSAFYSQSPKNINLDFQIDKGTSRKEKKFRDPLHSYYADFLPTNLEDLIAFNEVIFHSSTDVKSSLTKYIKYVLAGLEVELKHSPSDNSEAEAIKDKIEKDMGLLNLIQEMGLDFYLAGNVAPIILVPKTKFITCPSCGHTFKFSSVNKSVAGVDEKKGRLLYTMQKRCPSCDGALEKLPASEKVDTSAEAVNIIRWPVSHIHIEKSPFSNNAKYYLDFPRVLEQEYLKKSQVFLNDTPEAILYSIYSKKMFLMNDDYIFFMKARPIAASFGKFGMPPITDAIFRFIHAELLKRGNEAISLDHTVPMDVLFPNIPSSATGGIIPFNVAQYKSEVKNMIIGHRNDATRINFLPFPLGVQTLKGNGKALNLMPEIEGAEAKIADSFGIPREFFTGTLNFTAAPLALQLMENQMRDVYDSFNLFLRHLLRVLSQNNISIFSNIKSIKLREFKTKDNYERTQRMDSLFQMGKISNKTYMEETGIDLQEEAALISKEQKELLDRQIEEQKDAAKVTLSFGEQAKQIVEEGGMGAISNPYSPQNIQEKAEIMAQEMLQGDPNAAKSQLMQLKGQDYVLYSVVRTRYQELKYQMEKDTNV